MYSFALINDISKFENKSPSDAKFAFQTRNKK